MIYMVDHVYADPATEQAWHAWYAGYLQFAFEMAHPLVHAVDAPGLPAEQMIGIDAFAVVGDAYVAAPVIVNSVTGAGSVVWRGEEVLDVV